MARPHNTPATHVGELIDRGLRATGLNDQDKLAEICGVSPAYIVKLKKGQIRKPSKSVISRLASTLQQVPAQYQAAVLADHDELPDVASTIEVREGLHLTAESEHELNELVHRFVEEHRNRQTPR